MFAAAAESKLWPEAVYSKPKPAILRCGAGETAPQIRVGGRQAQQL